MFSAELNRIILLNAPKHVAQERAPDTYERLVSSAPSGLVVWSGASDNTIYGDTRVNHAFRAWHDSLHIKLAAEFSLDGERRVALEQARIAGGKYAEIIIAEVIGQAEYFAKHGEFPIDQAAFVAAYLKDAA